MKQSLPVKKKQSSKEIIKLQADKNREINGITYHKY